ncbi:kinesin-like protein KIN-5B isoform X2 [Aristolochia californica]|uniref:kinesin-like protein KIN-5B isoform X2 n=1 Tax=Aristolochia californica TaxID=171875 RepID=UPI0035D8B73B
MALTPEQYRKSGLTLIPSPAPFLTPRPERRRMDARWVEGNSNRFDRDKEVNVQVILRCRPLNDDEQRLNVPNVISCNEQRREVSILQNMTHKQVEKAFTFDKVFGPKSQQRSIYDQAIMPIVNEVLEGFNCTVFAYGQTGTGKTYTMEGGKKNKAGDLPVDAGVIPRAVRQIFDTLEAQKADYSMKVTFLELYNEEITDLLAPEDSSRSIEDKQRKQISLMEDGKGCVVVRGLEEEVVYSANEIYNLLERGSAKRRTADTLLNKHSSRSHSIFSITIHVKETTMGNEELIKCGKLNLVDLAGSENISRSGAREGRAREAGEINKSLLTLGRVITALVEHSGHVPYRDSKLTRLLRDSLGGKTKTCIIATISPSATCLDETLSTLDYAYRAKNIRNKPEANQKLSKSAVLKDLYLEIERLKQDVRSAREKNGVYIPHERFVQDEAEKKAMAEKIEHMEFQMDLKIKELDKFRELYQTEQERSLDLQNEVKDFKINMENISKALQDLQEKYCTANVALKEKDFIISNLLHSENSILERTKELRANLHTASEDMSALFTKLDHKNKIETENQRLVLAFGSELDRNLKDLHKIIVGSVSQQHENLRCMEEYVGSFIASKCEATRTLESRIDRIKDTYTSGVRAIETLASSLEYKASADQEQLKLTISAHIIAVENFMVTVVSEGKQVLHDMQGSLEEQKQLLDFSVQQQEEGLQRSLVSTQLISKATIDFFNELQTCADKVSKLIDENHIQKANQLACFEKTFKEESAKEEKLALEKFVEILAALTAKKTYMVSETVRSMKNENAAEGGFLQKEVLSMKNLCTYAKKDWNSYIEKVESQFQEDTNSAAETRVAMANVIEDCSKKVGHSKQQWESMQLSVDSLNKCNAAEVESTVQENILANQSLLKENLSISSSTNAAFDIGTCDLLTAINESLLLDHQAKMEMHSISSTCVGQLKAMQEEHSIRTKDIRDRSDRQLRKEYNVDSPTSTTPKRRAIPVPSLASIEELQTPPLDVLAAKMTLPNKTMGRFTEEKQQSESDPARSPLTALN